MIDTMKKHLKDAMISRNKERLNAIRNILAKLKSKEIEKKESLTKDESLKVLQSMAKQLKDSINQYTKGNREDLANKEKKVAKKENKAAKKAKKEALESSDSISLIRGVIQSLSWIVSLFKISRYSPVACFAPKLQPPANPLLYSD